jgi:hypothetical protein
VASARTLGWIRIAIAAFLVLLAITAIALKRPGTVAGVDVWALAVIVLLAGAAAHLVLAYRVMRQPPA